MQSVMQHSFSQVPTADIQRSSFDRSSGHKSTINAGYLYPVYLDEALPGDTFNMNATLFARMATPIYPIMDNLYLDIHFFACPIRLLWTNFKKFMGEQDDPGDSIDFTIPIVTSTATTGYAEGSLWDYMGIPPGIPDLEHSALFSRMYNKTWNEWYRDQNLQDSVVVDTDDGPDTVTDYVLLKRGKRHDYFTSSLPWPQKGDSVSIPLGTYADVVTAANTGANVGVWSEAASDHFTLTDVPDIQLGTANTTAQTNRLRADLTNATAATINQLRQAFQVQKLLERDARGGTRYPELIKAHFNVDNPDARMQRVEYLGGASNPIIINPIVQNSETGTTPQGTLAAIGTGSSRSGFVKSFTEHCLIMGIVSVRADLTYQQGLERMWSRSTRYDFYWPALANIGEQAVLNKEIYAQGSLAATDDDVFGYQERYGEYRYKPSRISGAMRSSAATPLDPWHLSQEFSSLPTLGDTFIQETPPMARVEATPSEPDFIFDSYFQLRCARPMPMYGVPGMIDRF
jgi:hypothetical protein